MYSTSSAVMSWFWVLTSLPPWPTMFSLYRYRLMLEYQVIHSIILEGRGASVGSAGDGGEAEAVVSSPFTLAETITASKTDVEHHKYLKFVSSWCHVQWFEGKNDEIIKIKHYIVGRQQALKHYPSISECFGFFWTGWELLWLSLLVLKISWCAHSQFCLVTHIRGQPKSGDSLPPIK